MHSYIDNVILATHTELSWMANHLTADMLDAAPPTVSRVPLADAIATCPPHHRDVALDRTETCRKCGDVRRPGPLRDTILGMANHERALRGAIKGGAATAAKKAAR